MAMLTYYITYFSVVILKYHNQKLLKEKNLLWLTVLEAESTVVKLSQHCWSRLITFPSTHTGNREKEQAVGPGEKLSKPNNNDILPSERHPTWRFHSLSNGIGSWGPSVHLQEAMGDIILVNSFMCSSHWSFGHWIQGHYTILGVNYLLKPWYKHSRLFNTCILPAQKPAQDHLCQVLLGISHGKENLTISLMVCYQPKRGPCFLVTEIWRKD